MTYFIDSHCHLHDPEFFNPTEQKKILKACQAAEVKKLICIGTSHADSLKARNFATEHENVFWSYGVHPSVLKEDLDFHSSRDTERGSASTSAVHPWRRAGRTRSENESSNLPKAHWDEPVAIGEVGLDYHYYKDNKPEQIQLFEEMIDLALKNNLPLIFHIREAFDDFFSVIDNFHGVRGVVHSFSDSKKNLKRCLDRDFYIGVNGLATYSTLPLPPLERTLLETDAPFLAPVPHRGERNNPSFIPDIARWLAEQHATTLDVVADVTTRNAENLFSLQ